MSRAATPSFASPAATFCAMREPGLAIAYLSASTLEQTSRPPSSERNSETMSSAPRDFGRSFIRHSSHHSHGQSSLPWKAASSWKTSTSGASFSQRPSGKLTISQL